MDLRNLSGQDAARLARQMGWPVRERGRDVRITLPSGRPVVIAHTRQRLNAHDLALLRAAGMENALGAAERMDGKRRQRNAAEYERRLRAAQLAAIDRREAERERLYLQRQQARREEEARITAPVSVNEAADLLAVNPSTVHRWIAEGRLPVVREPARGRYRWRYVIPWEALVEFEPPAS